MERRSVTSRSGSLALDLRADALALMCTPALSDSSEKTGSVEGTQLRAEEQGAFVQLGSRVGGQANRERKCTHVQMMSAPRTASSACSDVTTLILVELNSDRSRSTRMSAREDWARTTKIADERDGKSCRSRPAGRSQLQRVSTVMTRPCKAHGRGSRPACPSRTRRVTPTTGRREACSRAPTRP